MPVVTAAPSLSGLGLSLLCVLLFATGLVALRRRAAR